MKRAVFYSFNQQRDTFNVMVVYGNRGNQQVKRYPVLKYGLKVQDAGAYIGILPNSVLHMVWVNDSPVWYQTFDGPVVKVTSTAAPGTYYPDFIFTNKEGSYTVKKAVNVLSSESEELADKRQMKFQRTVELY